MACGRAREVFKILLPTARGIQECRRTLSQLYDCRLSGLSTVVRMQVKIRRRKADRPK